MLDTNQQPSDFSKDIRTLIADASPQIRTLLAGDTVDGFVKATTERYGLSGDQVFALHRGILFVLLGVFTPEDFAETLTEAGLLEPAVRNLMRDVNDRIFVPLGTNRSPVPSAKTAPLETVKPRLALPEGEVPRKIIPPIGQKPDLTTAIRQATGSAAPQKITPAPSMAPKPISPPVSLSSSSTPPPQFRTMAMDVETAHSPKKNIPAPSTRPSQPPRPVSFPVPQPVPNIQVVAPTRPTPTPQRVENKKYGVDPYREPVE